MTKQEFKSAWNSINQSKYPWYTYPLGWLMQIHCVISCALGSHSIENFNDEPKCMWCGKKFPKKSGGTR